MNKLILPIGIFLIGCLIPKTSQEADPSKTLVELADKFIEASKTDSSLLIKDNTIDALKAWEDFADSLYLELGNIDFSDLIEENDQITYWNLKEKLESNIALRSCKYHLWNVRHMYGWHSQWIWKVNSEDVGDSLTRELVISRWRQFPEIVSNEIENLKLGISQGYSAPKMIVELVVEQLKILLDYPLEESPFMSPVTRSNDETFVPKWQKIVATTIVPSLTKYYEFIKGDYLAAARDNVSLSSLPTGSDCYNARLRWLTTTQLSAQEIFDMGQELVNKNREEVEALGFELYQLDDFTEIVAAIARDSSNYFNSSDEIILYDSILMEKAKVASHDWFSVLPSSNVKIKPIEPYEGGSGSVEYGSDGQAYFRLSIKNPKAQTVYRNEKLTFHEIYPGHHIQQGIENNLLKRHEIGKAIMLDGFNEGWARYSEMLAEEMGLYQSKASLVFRRAWPGRGMVVDPGVHLFGWSEDRAIKYMMESGIDFEEATNRYNRIVALPGDLTSYDVGGEEFKALRQLAKDKLGNQFDIKEFHEKVLENGSIPLNALRFLVVNWIEDKLEKN